MASSADDKRRWAILPPPSLESSEISGELRVDPRSGRTITPPQTGKRRSSSAPVRREPDSSARAVTAPPESGPGVESAILGLEPADSQLRTERPAADDARRAEGTETIPAPSWADELD
ncbi:MAG TPA: hypothetical protein VLC09_13480 [Polyangiaceae bacterium]|nr:hypothetical protein [Polyangiaceae bacterium]